MLAPTVQLGDVVDLVGGGTPSKSNKSFYVGTIPWATVRDMKHEHLCDTEFKISEKAVQKSSTNIILAGNIITATRVGLGKVCVLQQDTAINQDLKALIPKDNRLEKSYLFWWLKSVAHVIETAGTGATVRGVKIPFVKALEIPLPTIPEQKRIAAILDQAFADIEQARARTEQNLKNARELFESYLQQVFSQHGEGWETTTLDQTTGGVYTGPFGSLLHKSDYVENGIPLINPAHITSTGIQADCRKTVSIEIAQRLASYIMREGDIVIARRGEMGRCAVITKNEDGFLCGTGSFFIKHSNRCDSGYLVQYLRSESCKARLEKIAGGAVMPNLSNKDLSKLNLELPPYETQLEMVKLIEVLSQQTKHLTTIYLKKLDALEDLKKSILQKAFSGELTKNENKEAAA